MRNEARKPKPKKTEITIIEDITGLKEIEVKTVIEKPQTYRSIQWDGTKTSIIPISLKFESLEHYTATKKGQFVWQIVTGDCGQMAVQPNDYILEATDRELKKEYYLIDPVHIEFYEVIPDDSIEL